MLAARSPPAAEYDFLKHMNVSLYPLPYYKGVAVAFICLRESYSVCFFFVCFWFLLHFDTTKCACEPYPIIIISLSRGSFGHGEWYDVLSYMNRLPFDQGLNMQSEVVIITHVFYVDSLFALAHKTRERRRRLTFGSDQ